MKIFTINLLLLLFLGSLVSCEDTPFLNNDDDEFVEPEYEFVTNAVFIESDELYFIDNFLDSTITKISAPDGVKKEVKISHDGTKIAYLNENDSPVIVNREGELIETLSDFTNVKSMNWTVNDSTLYMLIGNDIEFWGPEIDIPNIIWPTGVYVNGDPKVTAAAISSQNDIAYIVNSFTFTNGYQDKIVIRMNDGTEIVNYGAQTYDGMYCSFSTDDDLVIGYVDYFGDYPDFARLEIFEYDNKYEWEPFVVDNTTFRTPVYNSDSEYLMSGANGKLRLKSQNRKGSFDTEDYIHIDIEQYNPSSLDWK